MSGAANGIGDSQEMQNKVQEVTEIPTNFSAQSSGAHTICGIPFTNSTFEPAMIPA